MQPVLFEISEERERQIFREGFDVSHDDEHADGEMSAAAACYCLGTMGVDTQIWPWEAQWWKPKDRRRDLIRAAALIVAEIEKIDRANGKA